MSRPPFCEQRWFNDCQYPKCNCKKDDVKRMKRNIELDQDEIDLIKSFLKIKYERAVNPIAYKIAMDLKDKLDKL